MEHWEFWHALRDVTQRDDSREVGTDTLLRADRIFQPRKRAGRTLSLRPALAGMMRDAGPQNLIFEDTDGQFVELTHAPSEKGVVLQGFSAAGDTGVARLFGEDAAFETSISDGEFQFEGLPDGCYTMSLDHEGAHFWILDLSLKDSD